MRLKSTNQSDVPCFGQIYVQVWAKSRKPYPNKIVFFACGGRKNNHQIVFNIPLNGLEKKIQVCVLFVLRSKDEEVCASRRATAETCGCSWPASEKFECMQAALHTNRDWGHTAQTTSTISQHSLKQHSGCRHIGSVPSSLDAYSHYISWFVSGCTAEKHSRNLGDPEF